MAVLKLRDLVVEMAQKHDNVVNKQRGHVPRLVNDKPIFGEIKQFITHEASNLLLREWIATLSLAEELEESPQSCPSIEEAYSNVADSSSVDFNGTDYVPKSKWKMSFSGHSDAMVQRLNPVITKSGDRFENHGMALVEGSAIQSIDYGKLFPSHDREIYAKALAKFNAAFETHRKKYEVLPTTFVDPIWPKDPRQKKQMSADAEEFSRLKKQEYLDMTNFETKNM
ncbi:hypothetical protein MMC31_005324 [Peltigera leucophlebia]|nr:hypothetical protein [Peltigera leucophlebia]